MEHANVWKVVLPDQNDTVVGAIGLYVDDILETGRGTSRQPVAVSMSN